MCGIFGVFNFSGDPPANEILRAMSRSLTHRGPDADGVFGCDHLSMGNRRLAIIDPNPASNQPLYSDDRSIVLVQNGEIFNYVELRDELKNSGALFQTKGDTEVLLRAFEHWGDGFVERLNGMFAIAIYDSKVNRLLLYRDRLGVKPLYIAGNLDEGHLWFASEIKSILSNRKTYHPNFQAVAKYLALNYIPAPHTAFDGIYHVEPGHYLEISKQGVNSTCYWDLNQVQPDKSLADEDCKAGILSLLDDATRIRMRADTPFGAFLSGGLDSSSILGFMSDHSNGPVSTYSIGFDDQRYDESRYARMAAERFGARNVTEKASHDIHALWPRFIWQCDQPHGDVSFMPMDMVSRLAARDVKMVLTGDGADELFAGYEKYLTVFPDGQSDHLKDGWQDDFVRSSGLLLDDQPGTLLTGTLRDAMFDSDPYADLSKPMWEAGHQDPINQVLMAETKTLLPGNNLVKPDRMAMANSLEVRSPYLDYRLAEFAFKIPGHLKLTGGETKAILKQALNPMLGDELTYRKKQMFTVPVGEWFQTALADYCRQILLDGRLSERGIFDMMALQGMLESHLAGRANYTRQIRAIISLEIWFRLFIDQDDNWIVQATQESGQ